MGIIDSMRVPPEIIGLTGLLAPGATTKAAGARMDMFASHAAQARVLVEPEFPNVFTGFEAQFGDYTFDSTRRKNDIKVISVIDKYSISLGHIKPGHNPSRTVIYRDLKTGEISYFNVKRYSSHSNDYGYKNNIKVNISAGDVISPDVEIYSSPGKQGSLYCQGVNANVAFMTMLETTEDCFAISESLAKRLSSVSIETRSIKVNLKQYPLNLYGDEDYYRIFPDLGEYVRNDGIIAAWRPIKRYSAMSDLRKEKLSQVNYLFDHKIYGYPGAQVIDIDIYMGQRGDLPDQIYDQVKVYHEAQLKYFQEIVNVYQQCRNYQISHKFNTLISRAMGRLLAAKRAIPELGRNPKVRLTDKFNPISLQIDITLMRKITVSEGFKLTGREGAKGVVLIRPDEEMPIDDFGFKADICIDPTSVLKRTNIIQLDEQYINRLLKFEAMNLHKFGSIENQFKRIIEVLNDINPDYAEIVDRTHQTLDKQQEYVEECKNDTIKICIPPGFTRLTEDLFVFLQKKYQIPSSQVEFTVHTEDAGSKRVRTKEPVMIGSKYIYLLAKYPKPIAPGLGFVNNYHFPVSSKERFSYPIGSQPIRFGEAESRVIATAVGVEPLMRLRGLYGSTDVGPKELVKALVANPSPSTLDSVQIETNKLMDMNCSIRLAHHMFETCGVNLQDTIIEEDEANNLYDQLKSMEELSK